VRAIRRTGYQLAFTQGLRPKPILSLAMPLGVGVEGEDEICDFALKQRVPLTDFAKKLNQELPEGIQLKSVGPCFDRSKSASRVDKVSYRIDLAGEASGWEEAAAQFNSKKELVVLRQRPKGDKEVDVKKYVDKVWVNNNGGGLKFDMKVTTDGTARPEEVIALLEGFAGRKMDIARIVRTAIILKEEKPPAPRRRGRKRFKRRKQSHL